MTTAGVPLAPNASNTPKAPIATTIPANTHHPTQYVASKGRRIQQEQRQRRKHGREKVCNADEEKGLVTAIDGVLHGDLTGVKKNAVNAPRHDGQEGERQPGEARRIRIGIDHTCADNIDGVALLQLESD